MERLHDMPFGARVTPDGVRFRLWAPDADQVTLVLENDADRTMERQPNGWFELVVGTAGHGTRYRFKIGDASYPDPASRWQPDGMAGPSAVLDPRLFAWTDQDWRAPEWDEAILYELHTGTFSEAGDFAGVERHLDHMVALGLNFIELMPVAECPGRWNWGYDGVLPFAPASRYGGPEALKRLVTACHHRGIGVILDVVYNHFGPEGNFLPAYADRFFTGRYRTPWGRAINFDDQGAEYVRAFFIDNALYWLAEFHIDGLRFDAVQAIEDHSQHHFLLELGERIRSAFPARRIHLIVENDRNDASLLGYGRRQGQAGPYDAQWNDDFHHVMRVLIAGAADGYYADYRDHPIQHLGRALAEGYAYQGERSVFRDGKPRGTPSATLPPTAFVNFIQNHDQVGNHAYGWRLPKFAGTKAVRAATVILLLSPAIPLLFMGQEWGAEQPFPFFCDFSGDLAEAIRKGRLNEFSSFDEFRDPRARALIPDPLSEATFRSAKLDWSAPEREEHREQLLWYRDLIARRRADILPRCKGMDRGNGQFETLAPGGLRVRWRLGDGSTLTLLANLSTRPLAGTVWAPTGETVFQTDAPDEPLPPWHVSFHLSGEA